MAVNLFDELKKALQDFKDFLHPKVDAIKGVVQQVAAVVPQLKDLIDQLIELLGKLKTEIENLDPKIPGLSDVSEMTAKAKAALVAAKNLLPDEAETIDQVIGITDVVSSLPSLDQVKGEITALIDDLIADLGQLKPT
jgi:ABC-type transporter Mla subunit MlaD